MMPLCLFRQTAAVVADLLKIADRVHNLSGQAAVCYADILGGDLQQVIDHNRLGTIQKLFIFLQFLHLFLIVFLKQPHSDFKIFLYGFTHA